MTYIICELDLRSLRLRIAGLERENLREFVCVQRERRNGEEEGASAFILKTSDGKCSSEIRRNFLFWFFAKNQAGFFPGKFHFPTIFRRIYHFRRKFVGIYHFRRQFVRNIFVEIRHKFVRNFLRISDELRIGGSRHRKNRTIIAIDNKLMAFRV